MHTPPADHHVASPFQALFDEERAKDIATCRVAATRRFWSTIFITAVLIAGLRMGLAKLRVGGSSGTKTLELNNNASTWIKGNITSGHITIEN
jgi:hypothetical protein